MLLFRVLKEIKKKLKRKRRHVWSLGIGAAVFALATLAGSMGAYAIVKSWSNAVQGDAIAVFSASDKLGFGPGYGDANRDKTIAVLRERKEDVELVLHRTYLCGEETRKLGTHSAEEAYNLLLAHREWDASLTVGGKVTLTEDVDDLSPQCRKTAYIGVDQEGNLSLFNGPPQKDKVVRTFFQLDVKTLQTSLTQEKLEELMRGIRVSDKDEYNSVISTFSDYARMKSQGVLSPAE
ncbi:BofC C-terminal domain-containing protein [Cohnella yongneupensis]|uniref:BofC C-terminal domain-containing protein n=1 Tax=Cohnella yongneupensis TaxID=425006 RepID=A0ABW0QWZ6_9BACL